MLIAPDLDSTTYSQTPEVLFTSTPARAPVLLALTGPAGCGKSSAAAHLHIEHDFVRERFAYPLKSMLRAFLVSCGVDHDEIDRMIEGDLKEVGCDLLRGQTPRYALQTLGTEWGRALIGDDLWVNAWKQSTRMAMDDGYSVVAEDCRFPNEAAAIREMGGLVVGIRRPDMATIATSGHVSEAGVEPDYWVENNGPIEILFARIEGMVDRAVMLKG